MIKQIWRGMGYLPIVGEHPGNAAMIFIICMGVIFSIISPLPFWQIALFVLPWAIMYLIGAYDRACFNDEVEANA